MVRKKLQQKKAPDRYIVIPDYGEADEFSSVQGNWRVTYRMRRTVDGVWAISELKIERHIDLPPNARGNAMADAVFAPLPRGGINYRVVRSLGLGTAAAYGRMVMETQRLDTPPTATPRKSKHPGRPVVLTAFYRDVATRWRELTEAGVPDPAAKLATRFKYRRTSMRAVLWRCRRMGLIPPSGRPRRA
jgi:hypothetical protein